MFSKLIKTAKFMAEWADWALLYPIWLTESGREQIIRTGLYVLKKHPEKRREIKALIDMILEEETPDDSERSCAETEPVEAEVLPEDKTSAAPPVKRSRFRPGMSDISDLKRRLGLKKT